jgi:hypothetical protein
MNKEKPEITNKMKANCIGEFSWKEETSYYDEDGNLFEDVEVERTVPWTLCKDIYKKMYLESPLPDRITTLEERVKLLETFKEIVLQGWQGDIQEWIDDGEKEESIDRAFAQKIISEPSVLLTTKGGE